MPRLASAGKTGIGVPSQVWATTWNSKPPITPPGAAGTDPGSTGIRTEILTDWDMLPNTLTVTRPSSDVKLISWPGVEQVGGGGAARTGAGGGGGGPLSSSLSLPLPLLSLPLRL